MSTMKTRWYVRVLFVAAVLCGLLTSGYVALTSANMKTRMPHQFYTLQTNQRGWEYLLPDGPVSAVTGATVEAVEGRFTLRREVFPEEMECQMLFFRNNRQGSEVTAEGETLFRMGVGERNYRFGTNGYCAVALPEKGRPYLLEVTFYSTGDGLCRLPELHLCRWNDVLVHTSLMDLVAFSSVPLWLTLGVVLAVLRIVLARRKIAEERVACLAAFLIFSAGWNMTDLYFIGLLPVDMEACSVLSYFLMMFMPLPVLDFVRFSCKYRRPKSHSAIVVALLVNIFTQTALFLTGKYSMNQMVIFSQAALILMLLYGVAATALDYRANPTKQGKIQSMAFSIDGVMGTLVVVAYWMQPNDPNLYRIIFQGTVFVFLVAMLAVLGYTMEQRRYESKVKDAEIKTFRILSNIDQLTGLNNRRAFERRMEEIQSQPERHPNATLIFMDLNGLKYANDKFGHMAGDELIIAAGRCMHKGFHEQGKCYRVGGDEFAAIVEGDDATVAQCCTRMDRAIETYNSTAKVPLSIARGSSTLVKSDGERMSANEWKMTADKRMYENKASQRRASTRGNAEAYLEIISSFVSAVDAKDSYTADHSKRVAQLAGLFCRLLGLSETTIDQVNIAACLHDIGKIGIPDSILCKTDKLTQEEWKIMKSHPAMGEEIVKHNRAFYEVSRIIRHHHERYDGKGYPDGIAGSEIPLGARIIAVADSIDAMTSSRSYRKALTLDFCKEEIRKNMGIMYDSAVATIVLEHWEEVEKIVTAQNPKPAPLNEGEPAAV